MSRLSDARRHAEHLLKQADSASTQREEVSLMVQAHDVLYRIGVDYYHAKTMAAERKIS